jgi:hypothetical protein
MRLRATFLPASSALVLALTACSDGTSPESSAQVTLSFVSATAAGASSPSAGVSGPLRAVDATGANGTLTIDEVQIVVDEFKLESVADACEEAGPGGCAPFETPPYFLDLPLDAVPIDIGASAVSAGTYVALKLETKDFESSVGDPGPPMDALRAEVLAEFPDWPASASLRVAGSFDPIDEGTARDFVVYFHAEVKVELGFDPALSLLEGDEEIRIVVEVDPVAWFTLPGGMVSDLSELDYETTGEVVDFEAKMADGFTKIEIDG